MNSISALLKSALASAALVMAFVSPSQALVLTPAGTTCTEASNSNLTEAQVEAKVLACFALVVDLTEQYKADVGTPVVESGPFAASYQTTYSNTPTDPEDALIEHVVGTPAISCPYCFAVVKDGNATPAQYIFALTGWNGTEDLVFQDFWPNGGAISHISIYSGRLTEPCEPGNPFCEDQDVPEPGTLLLIGIGALGFALRRRWMA